MRFNCDLCDSIGKADILFGLIIYPNLTILTALIRSLI